MLLESMFLNPRAPLPSWTPMEPSWQRHSTWHGKTRFLPTYATLMKKTPDKYTPKKGLEIYELARDSITTRGEDPYIWAAQDQCIDLLAAA